MEKNKILLTTMLFIWLKLSLATSILIPMDEGVQRNHLKAYGIAYWTLQNNLEIQWLLNYRGGSFLLPYQKAIEAECIIRGVSYEQISDGQTSAILAEIAQPEVNMDAIKLEKAPKIAVYSPKNLMPWDDAVTLVLTYAEIPYTVVYDEEIVRGDLQNYDWLHLHHEDFTGQFGKFWSQYKNMPWYQTDVQNQKQMATKLGFEKVSKLKQVVVKNIREFVGNGGFMFAMCSATDTYDIALAAEGVDIVDYMFDGDGIEADAQNKLNFEKTFAFKDFKISINPYEYEYSDIDNTYKRNLIESNDYFTLFDFSAKWDPIPSMLCQNHNNLIKGFMGQTTAFSSSFIKSGVLVMGENKQASEARYIHGEFGKGTWTFYSGHDPEDYKHLVGDKPTDLSLYPNSPGYRLILNNILFPAAKKKKLKT